MNDFDLLGGVVGCLMAGFGLIAGILMGGRPVILTIMIVGLVLMALAMWDDDRRQKKARAKYPTYNYSRW